MGRIAGEGGKEKTDNNGEPREGEGERGRERGREIVREREERGGSGGEERHGERKCSTNSHILIMERRIRLIRRHH